MSRKTAGEIERELLAQTDTNDDILHEKRVVHFTWG